MSELLLFLDAPATVGSPFLLYLQVLKSCKETEIQTSEHATIIRSLVSYCQKLVNGSRSSDCCHLNTDTPEGRSKERLRRVALTAFVSAFAQGISMLTLLISIPLTLNYLGAERYGLWITISSLITVLGFADLGMGNGFLNAIAEANGRNDRKSVKSYVSSAFYILTGIALFFGVIWIMVYPHVSWTWLFNVTTPKAMAEAGPAVLIFIWCMLVNLPIGLVQKIYDGYQEGYVNGLWRVGSSLLGLVSVLLAIYLQADLPLLVLAMAGSPVLVLFLNAVLLFGRPTSLATTQIADG